MKRAGLPKKLLPKKLLPKKLSRGQAMVEYSFVAHAILLGGALALMPMLSRLLGSLSAYYESIYFVLTSPIP